MSVTVNDIERLERLYATGFKDAFLDQALRKVLERQIARDEADLARVRAAMSEFERQYEMDSETFWQRYRAGKMADTADYMEWNVLCKMQERLMGRLAILRDEAGHERN